MTSHEYLLDPLGGRRLPPLWNTTVKITPTMVTTGDYSDMPRQERPTPQDGSVRA